MASKAVVLLSGGLDSAVCLAIAKRDCDAVRPLTVDYGQRHGPQEIAAARTMSSGIPSKLAVVELPVTSPLLGTGEIPKGRTPKEMAAGTAPTYVPGRNAILLSLAASYAEHIGAGLIYFGANADDFAGYPDCRPDFFARFEAALGGGVTIMAPLLGKTKAEVIALAKELGVDVSQAWSCYDPRGDKPCGRCDACILRGGV